MELCPRCGTRYPGLRYCPEHGQPLLWVPDVGDWPWPGEEGLDQQTDVDRKDEQQRQGTLVAGRYRLQEVIGLGGMGTVWRAENIVLGRTLALKLLRRSIAHREQTVLRFEREARAIAALEHPHVVTVHDFGQAEDGSLYLVMELLQGQDLFDLLAERRWLELPRALRISRQIASGLAEAWRFGLIHRDLKPENVFLVGGADQAEQVKLLDFGLAKFTWSRGPGEPQLSQPGISFGTAEYLAPEQARGEPVDHRSDLYGLGVLLFRMISGRLPFSGRNKAQIVWQHLHQAPPSLASLTLPQPVPPAVTSLVARLLAKDPGERPADAEALLRELDELG